MTTFYCDYEGGSDAADGTTFANRWKTWITGATAARIAPGDTIRQMASPDPTSLGINGTWTDGPLPATTAITSSTNATPIVVTRATHGLTSGDTVCVNAHTTNTKANGIWKVNVLTTSTFQLLNADGTNSVGNGAGGATGTFRKINNLVVILASAVTKAIAVSGNQGAKTNWTASASVTCTVITTDFKEGGECQQIAVAAGFTTGLAAYFATGTIDFSGYQQISFWIKQTTGTIGAASSITLKLCSDVAGATAVDTFNIPGTVALNQWIAFTIDKGSALGNAIKSIGFYVNTDNAAQTFFLDNIIAVKAASADDSLSLTSLISKNTTDESWCSIGSINDVRVALDAHNNSRIATAGGTYPRGYSGTTETVTAYKRETIKQTPAATSGVVVNVEQIVQDSGTVGSPITFSGGWNRTDMSTQTGETWFSGQNGFGTGPALASKNYVTLDKISSVRYSYGAYFATSHDIALTGFHGNNHTVTGLNLNQNTRITLGVESLSYNVGAGINSPNDGVTGTIKSAAGNLLSGLILMIKKSDLTINRASNNGAYGLIFDAYANDLIVRDLTTAGNTTGGVALTNALNSTGANFLYNALISDTVEVATVAFSNGRLWSKSHDQTADNDVCFTDGGMIYKQIGVRHTASGFAWQVDVTSTNRGSAYPLDFEIARVAVAANALVTVKAWLRRATTNLTMGLVCKGGQIAGVAADEKTDMSAAINTWEEVTISFTPTEAGVVIITTESYWTAGSPPLIGYVDDLTITQA